MSSLKYLVLAGPTAVGKSDLAIEIAQKLQTEIVGADAFQIYDGLDILTAKPSLEQLAAVPHHLVGILPLIEMCDAHRYAQIATQVIQTLNEKGIVPLVSGGTGFYLDSLAGILSDLPSADQDVRNEFEQRSLEELLVQLRDLDPVAWEKIDRNNRRRVIRALEVCLITEKPFSSFRSPPSAMTSFPRFWLERSRADLYERIDRRIDRMFDLGVVSEVAAISDISPTASQAIGFRHIRTHLTGELAEQDCRDAIKQLTRNYAKRQITWFRNRGYEPISADQPVDRIIEILRTEAK
jgi:tRNA dimethylallyltransferase